ncbi:MAG: hypothetical protein JO033_02055 [Acidobacteriaceae bacterium]|nr:hypothetical protein [Acidobacteriaceae bacterium]MBV9502832.1 hypothetical protein [Acidobacteriaceae bacterium]
MYEIERKDGRVTISDWNGKAIYRISETAYIAYRNEPAPNITVAQVKSLRDDELVAALAQSVKVALD